jgi:hypothetical protein
MNRNIRTLYANGCSLTFGMEVGGEIMKGTTYDTFSDYKISDEQDQRRQRLIWPMQLKHLLVANDIEVQNVLVNATNGSSNDRIVRTVIHDIRLKELGPEDLVIIGWTESERFEVVHEGNWLQHSVNMSISFPYRERKFAEEWGRLMCNDDTKTWERFLTQVLIVQDALNAHGIPFVMFNALPVINMYDPEAPDGEIEHSIKFLWCAVNRLHWVTDMNRRASCMYEQTRGFPVGPLGHPMAEGHAFWARRIYPIAKFVLGMANNVKQHSMGSVRSIT